MEVALGLVALGGRGLGGAARRTVFRAVSSAELHDIAAAQCLRPAPGGSSMEAKLFAETASDAARFGRANFHLLPQEVYTVAVLLTDEGYQLLEAMHADGRRCLSADREVLPQLNAEIVLVVALEVNAWQ